MSIPSLFISHGSPMNMMNTKGPINQFWKRLGESLREKYEIKGIVVVSAHWNTDTRKVISPKKTEDNLFYDFYGFPSFLYKFKYSVKGDDGIVNRLKQLLNVSVEEKRHYDHGVFVVLSVMFPEELGIPIVQLSSSTNAPISKLIEDGKKLRKLRDEGILIVGSGSETHNINEMLEAIRMDDDTIYDDTILNTKWAIEFSEDLQKEICGKQRDIALVEKRLENYSKILRHSSRAHPTDEHFRPLFYALGSAVTDGKFSCAYVLNGKEATGTYVFDDNFKL